MPKFIDLRRVINFDIDYYAVLGLQQGCLMDGTTRQAQQHNAKILTAAMRTKMWNAHPDHGGSDEQFKLVMNAHSILEHDLWRKYWETRGKYNPRSTEDGSSMEIDWDQMGTYQQGTQADTVGYGLFMKLNERASELDIVPAFFPTLSQHSYEWDWAIPDMGAKLSLSLVYDAGEILQIANQNSKRLASALPFKIYFCFPRAALSYVREEKEVVVYDDRCPPFIFNGRLRGTMYNDYSLLETVYLDDALQYMAPGGKIETDLSKFRDGSMIEEMKQQDVAAAQSKWVTPEQMKLGDAESIKDILRRKSFLLTPQPEGDKLLDYLPPND